MGNQTKSPGQGDLRQIHSQIPVHDLCSRMVFPEVSHITERTEPLILVGKACPWDTLTQGTRRLIVSSSGSDCSRALASAC
jgi:hypothetical protein